MSVKHFILINIFLFFIATISSGQATNILKTIIVDAGHGGTDVGAVGQYENSLRSREKDITLAISRKVVAELKKSMPDINVVPTRTTDVYQTVKEKADIANLNKGNLFLCIHADSGPLKTGSRQVGTKTVTKYKVSYTGKGKKRKKITKPYQVEVPIYEYFKKPMTRSGTSVWIFAAHKTSDKLKAIMNDVGEFDIESSPDSASNNFDFTTPEGKILAQVYAKRYQERSDLLAELVNEEVAKTGLNALGVNQRQKGIWVLQATNMPAILVETGFINNPEDEAYLNSEKGQQEMAVTITKAVMRYREKLENGKSMALANVVSEKPKEQAKAVLAASNNTQSLQKRQSQLIQTVGINREEIQVDIYDNGDIDGDVITLLYNNEVLASNVTLSSKPLTFKLKVNGNMAINELLMYAHNEGTIPPNTARMVVSDGDRRYEIGLSSDTRKNGIVRFILNKR